MHREPHGETRDDLRIGALASVMWNCNIDTSRGTINPQSYIAGFTEGRDGVFVFNPKEIAGGEEGDEKKQSGGGKLDLNDPIDWENFATGLRKYQASMTRGSH